MTESRRLHLSVAGDFSTSNALSRTYGTVKRVAQTKIDRYAKNTGGVSGSASKQAGVVQMS